MPTPSSASDQLAAVARALWRSCYQGTLATHSATYPGYPFASVAPLCLDRQGLPLLLLSHLAQHTRNLAEDPRCGLPLSQAGATDVQQAARLSTMGDCTPVDDGDARERYFRCFPHTRPYFEELGFRLYHLHPQRFHLNAGFAAARWLGRERVVRPNPLEPAVESRLRKSLEARQDLLRQITDSADGDWSVAGVDGAGMDLRREQHLVRIDFSDTPTTGNALAQLLEACGFLAATGTR